MDNNSKTVLWHIGDIHIFQANHKKIKYAFDQLINRIKITEATTKFLIIAGDVFEHKTKVSQRDLECFHYLLDHLKNYPITIITIPGNHDYSINSKLDLIESALINTNYKNVFHYPKSGIYEHKNIDFYVLSPMDGKEPEVDNSSIKNNKSNHLKIAIVHEPIKGCQLYTGMTLSEGRFTWEYLTSKYDITMAGDIHKRQHNGNAAYCGSLIQKNKGEDLFHGGIEWIIDSNNKIQGNPFNLQLLDAFLIYKAFNNKIIGSYPTTLVDNFSYIELRYKKCTKQYLDTISSQIKNKYGRLDKITNKNDITLEQSETDESQLDIIEKLMPNRPDIIELHKNNLARRQTSNPRVKWELLSIQFENMFRFGENNYIDFTKITELTSIVGKNYIGKSSIIEILLFVLFDSKKIRGTRQWILRSGSTNYWVKARFRTGSKIYEIFRSADQHKNIKYNLTEIIGTKQNIIQSADINEMYDTVKSIIGSEEDFLNVNLRMQDAQSFTDKTHAKQQIDIMNYLDMDWLISLEKETKSEINLLTRQINEDSSRVHDSNLTRESYDRKKKYLQDTQSYIDQLKKTRNEISQGLNIDFHTIDTTLSIENITEELSSSKISTEDIQNIDILKDELSKLPRTQECVDPQSLQSAIDELNTFRDFRDFRDDDRHHERIPDVNPKKLILNYSKEKLLEIINSSDPKLQNNQNNQNNLKQINDEITKILITYPEIQDKVPSKPQPFEINQIDELKNKLIDTNKINQLMYPNSEEKSLSERISSIMNLISQLPTINNFTRKTNLPKDELLQIIQTPIEDPKYIPMLSPVKPIKPSYLTIPFLKYYDDLLGKINIIKTKNLIHIPNEINSQLTWNNECDHCKNNKSLLSYSDESKNLETYIKQKSELDQYKIDFKNYKSQLSHFNENNIKLQQHEQYISYINAKNDLEYINIDESIAKRTNLQEELTKSTELLKTLEQNRLNKLKSITKHNESINNTIQEYNVKLKSKNLYDNYLKLTDLIKQKQETQLYLDAKNDIEYLEIEKSIQAKKNYLRKQHLTKLIESANNYVKLEAKILGISRIIYLQDQLAKQTHNKEQMNIKTKISNELKIIDQKIDEASKKVLNVTKTLISNENDLKLLDNIKQKSHEKALKQDYVKILDSKRGLPVILAKKQYVKIETVANSLLQEITDFTIKLSPDGLFISSGTFIPATQASGFQKFIIDFVIRLTLIQIHPYVPSIIIIDEGFGCMDEEHLHNAITFLSNLHLKYKDKHRKIIVISHIDDIKELGNRIHITESNGVSHIMA